MSYVITESGMSATQFQKLIDAESISNEGVSYSDPIMTVYGTFTTEQEATMDALVPECQLMCAKEMKLVEIELNTKSLRTQGVAYGGDVYPLDDESKSNYIGIQVFAAFPYTIQNTDGTDTLVFTDQATFNLFMADAMTRFLYIVNGGSTLVDDVKNATTILAVEAITDNRS